MNFINSNECDTFFKASQWDVGQPFLIPGVSDINVCSKPFEIWHLDEGTTAESTSSVNPSGSVSDVMVGCPFQSKKRCTARTALLYQESAT